jgi:HD-GYP domain-containing protein (c-di-GMP phosphodiesterase class II)
MMAGDLKHEMNQLRGKLDAIKDLPFGLEKYPDIRSLLDHYIEVILNVTDTDAGSIILLDEPEPGDQSVKPALVMYSCAGPASEKLRGWHVSYGEGIAGWVVSTGAPYFSDDVKDDPKWSKIISETVEYPTKDIMCVPVKVGPRIIGAVEVLNKRGLPFNRDDLGILTFIAGHVGVMVENSRLLRGYEVKVTQMATLMELGTLLNSTLRKDEIRRRSIEAITELVDAEVGSLLLVDEAMNELYFEVALGDEDKQKAIKEIRLKIGEGIAGWVAAENRPVLINDVQNDPRFYKTADKKSKFVTRNMVCAPVTSKGRVLGVLQAMNKLNDRKFTSDDLKALESLANQVAIAIENSMLYDKLRQTFMDTSEALAEAIEKRDPYTGGHTKRVLEYSSAIGRRMGFSAEEIDRLELAAVLHDVGKIGVSDLILGKQAPLDDDEFAAMKNHPEFGADIVNHVPDLVDIVPGIRDHHERVDGKGYPDGLTGDEIELNAKIIAVADSFDAMTTSRPYREGLSVEYALSELKRCTGSQFDGEVVEAFKTAFDSGEILLSDK